MRFIFNFIFYGFLFFLIWHFFPDAFLKLVGWAEQAFEWLSGAIIQLMDKVPSTPPSNPVIPEPFNPPLVPPITPLPSLPNVV